MTKRKGHLDVTDQLNDIFTQSEPVNDRETHALTIEQALARVKRQMEISNYRERTIVDYEHYVSKFAEFIDVKRLADLKNDHIYAWLSSMDVSNQTKLTRLKCLKAFLNKCYRNGWLSHNFWRDINVKVDTPIKKGTAENDIHVLLRMLDLSDFVQLRDAAAVMVMYRTGIRLRTLCQLKESHVDLTHNQLEIDGGLIKNHESMMLPFDDITNRLLDALIKQNDKVRRVANAENDYLFISRRGRNLDTTPTNNTIGKRLVKYSNEFGLENLSAHAIRRAFAKRLMRKGASVDLISKALGHKDLSVTTRYLQMDKEEVAAALRGYLD
ncbi:tyrosine-type recombinase/integrase [Alkalibacillus almallahensis]|uniref:tyrosine-type recombinase/integrase n=1 Tax=Alkalibacillus almallahensis TaxID=1379154 RepID=UPI0014220C2C|nr:site-specific integrase [Alkalibacillus almallahensis]NIK11150.1 site-specific recombinase XerD [Alkalibacillus almallahensis]